MKSKFYFCLFIWSACVFPLQAQDIRKETAYQYDDAGLMEYSTIFKYYPTALLNPSTPTFQFGIQQNLSSKIHVEFSAGYATTFNGQWVKVYPLSGYLLRLEGLFAIYKKPESAIFLGLQGIYKNFTEKRTEEFSRFNNAFQQVLQFEAQKEQFAGNFILLFQRRIGKNWLFELAAGQGWRSHYRKDVGIPEDAVSLEADTIFNFDQPGREVYPSIHLRAGVGVNLSGKRKGNMP